MFSTRYWSAVSDEERLYVPVVRNKYIFTIKTEMTFIVISNPAELWRILKLMYWCSLAYKYGQTVSLNVFLIKTGMYL